MRVRFTARGRDAETGVPLDGVTEDIAPDGLFLRTTSLRPVGTELHLELAAPSGGHVAVEGLVVWGRAPTPLRPDEVPGLGIRLVRRTDPWLRLCEELARHAG